MVSESSFSWMIDVTNRLNGSHSAHLGHAGADEGYHGVGVVPFHYHPLVKECPELFLHGFDG